MPFTISHAAVVLPVQSLLSRYHLMSAAVIGSMVPDFGLVLPIWLARSQTHSFVALFTFCIPMGLLAWWLFQVLIKPALLELMPDRWYLRLSREHPAIFMGNPRTWLLAAAAIWLGAVSHLVLDGFTHDHGRGTLLIPSLDDATVLIAGREVLVYRLLQYVFSVIGLALLAVALWHWLRTTAPVVVPSRRLAAQERRWWALGLLVLPVVAALRAAWYMARVAQRYGAADLLYGRALAHVAIDGLEAIVASLIIVSALIMMRLFRVR